MMNQRPSNKKHINRSYQIASGVSNQRTKFVRFSLKMHDFSPHYKTDGAVNFEKTYL